MSRFLYIFFIILLSSNSVHVSASDYTSPVDLDLFDNGTKILVTDHTGKQLIIFDVESESVLKKISLNMEPSGAVYDRFKNVFYITAGYGPGVVFIIDPVKGKVLKKIQAGHGVNSPILSRDGQILYVCSRFENAVNIIDLDKKKVTKSIPVLREPVAADITPDGKKLYVVNHMPDGRADIDYVASKLSVIDLEKEEIIEHVKLVNGAEGMRGVCVSPDGKYVYATHLMARFQVPTTQIERGWINTNALSVVRVNDEKLLFTVLLDDMYLGFSNPWAVKASEDGKLLCVSSAGNHELRLIDLPAMNKKINDRVAQMGENADAMHLNAHNDLSFISDVSKRIQLKGMGPRSMLIKGKTIYTGEYFSESIGKLEFKNINQTGKASSIQLKEPAELTAERQGEIFFNDASLCFQQWQSCASCHSDDGRVDALNWDLLNDGMGNPKNVKSLLQSHYTPPVMALGVRADAETAVRAGIKYIQFAVRPEEDAQAIDRYLKNLKPVPSPKLKNGKLSKAAKKGKKVFKKASCNHCHPAPFYTNLKSYDLGTGKGQDAGKKFDTSTLVEVWRTSPYWHDGRATSIPEAIKLHYESSKYTLNITEEELNDLCEYIESL